MKPEKRLHQHVQCGGQIVTTADVAQLMRHHRLQLRVAETAGDSFRQQHHRTEDADNPRLQRGFRDHEPDLHRTARGLLQPSQHFQFATGVKRRCPVNGRPQALPAPPPEEQHGGESTKPAGQQQSGKKTGQNGQRRRRGLGCVKRRERLADLLNNKDVSYGAGWNCRRQKAPQAGQQGKWKQEFY